VDLTVFFILNLSFFKYELLKLKIPYNLHFYRESIIDSLPNTIRFPFIQEGIENKIPTHILMSMSGHTTEKVFRKYFSTTTKELGEEGSKLFSYDLIDVVEPIPVKSDSENIPQTKIEKLKELKLLFDEGLIPNEVYLDKVRELL
jgi:hypothetical protein